MPAHRQGWSICFSIVHFPKFHIEVMTKQMPTKGVQWGFVISSYQNLDLHRHSFLSKFAFKLIKTNAYQRYEIGTFHWHLLACSGIQCLGSVSQSDLAPSQKLQEFV